MPPKVKPPPGQDQTTCQLPDSLVGLRLSHESPPRFAAGGPAIRLSQVGQLGMVLRGGQLGKVLLGIVLPWQRGGDGLPARQARDEP